MALRKTKTSKRTLSQQHRKAISDGLKRYHANKGRGKKTRGKRVKPVNDNNAGFIGGPEKTVTLKTQRGNGALPYKNRYLAKRQLKAYKNLRSKLKHNKATLNDHSTYNKAAHKAERKYKRTTRINNFLSKLLPATKKRSKH